MGVIKSIFNFLGGVHFAICLIAVTALFVIAGTLIESKTGSHLYAALYTYQNPAFLALVGLFFINILFAALRRWPFKPGHIPFLITHLGLLLILAGVIFKNLYGIQGTMSMLEGSGSDEILIPNSHAVRILKKNDTDIIKPIFGEYHFRQAQSPFPELDIETLEYSPHGIEKTETWIKGSQGIISGLQPFKVFSENEIQNHPIPISARAALLPSEFWNVIACKTSNISKLMETTYLNGLSLIIFDIHTNENLFKGNLADALETAPVWDKGKAELKLSAEELSLSAILYDTHRNFKTKLHIPLSGPEALQNINVEGNHLGKFPFAIALERTPTLIIAEDSAKDIYLFAYAPHGEIYTEKFPSKELSSFISYDNGWGGYYAAATIPFSSKQQGSDTTETAALLSLKNELNKGVESHQTLSAPLLLLQNACLQANVDFADCCVEFLSYWNNQFSWLYPLDSPAPPLFSKASQYLNWGKTPNIHQACKWLSHCFYEIDAMLQQNISLDDIRKTVQWPLPISSTLDHEEQLTAMTQQIFSVGELLPKHDLSDIPTIDMQARWLSAYFRAYGIHLSALPLDHHELKKNTIELECPISLKHVTLEPPQKIEDRRPIVKLKIKKGTEIEYLTLAYDPNATGLYWPGLKGEYLFRFQPQTQTIPYRIRLRNARQINYPHSTQPFSYESDLLITDNTLKTTHEKTISMNKVHETWDGFRFYLAGMAPGDESAVKRIQLVINHDPAKYWLTYPGAIILSLGIVLLFWKYNPKKQGKAK